MRKTTTSQADSGATESGTSVEQNLLPFTISNLSQRQSAEDEVTALPSSMLVREVPEEIREWIERKRESDGITQNDFLLSLLDEAYRSNLQIPLFRASSLPSHPKAQTVPFMFIDLFAGIGGLRLGLEHVGGQCVFSSEWDRYAQKTYKAWHGETPHGDIRKIRPSEIPDHDILAAGFPCQPFSIAGVSKKKSLGREHGFRDQTQGTLFFYLASIIEAKRPPVLLLENVKNLLSHDQGKTWQVIKSTLGDLRYHVFHQVIDAAGWVPQHRERVFIVCFDENVFPLRPRFVFPKADTDQRLRLRGILESKPLDKYTLSDHLWRYLQDYAARHRDRGNGFGFSLADRDGITRTLSARYFKDGSEILIPQRGRNPRRLTPRECARLMGFPDELKLVVSDTQAYKQFGNAVVPPVAAAVGRQIVAVLVSEIMKNGCILKRNISETTETWQPSTANTRSMKHSELAEPS
jgi:DNA (cytosine-5)-methyltransferase 1